jgi:hypothetical protein
LVTRIVTSLEASGVGIPAFADEIAIQIAVASDSYHALLGSPGNANHLVNRVVQKASFRSPEFIGFFAPISEIRAGLLPTVN